MTERIAPNPASPYANADPGLRHLIPSFFGILPDPGVLAPTACDRMAVVPDDNLSDASAALKEGRIVDLPPGLCPVCISVASGESSPGRDAGTCRECGDGSLQGDWCALCRQELHAEWWHTRDQQGAPS